MDSLGHQPELREALSILQQYLSDSIPPLLAAKSVAYLLNAPADLAAEEIDAWIASQFTSKDSTASYSDYLFHALRKLYEMGQFELLPVPELNSYLEHLKGIVVERCPIEEREFARDTLNRLGQSETTLSSTVAFLHRPLDRGEAAAEDGSAKPAGGYSRVAESDLRYRRLSLLLERLEKEPHAMPTPAVVPERKEEMISRVIAAAAANATTGSELRQVQQAMAVDGVVPETDQIFRMLSRSLPGWVIPVSAESGTGMTSHIQNSALEAMRRMIQLAENEGKGGQRVEELVDSAIEQFNEGSLARSVTMLELAENLISHQEINMKDVARIRRTAHKSLDPNRLRAYADKPEKHHLLHRVLDFFDRLKPEGLLDDLQNEQKRDRRRLILSLLEAHGSAARLAAFERLESVLASVDVARDWYFLRNLLCILGRIPKSEDTPLEKEIWLMASLLKPSYPAPLVREALSVLGQIQHGAAEQLLITTVDELEKVLLGTEPASVDAARLKSLLDRAVLQLAKYGTIQAYRAVVNHGLKRQDELGDCLARLSYLAGQNLSADEESITHLLGALKNRIPRRVLGVVIQKNAQQLLHLIKALSSTPARPVILAFEEITKRFLDQEFGKAASKALHEFQHPEEPGDAPTERLLGDLELFGLPDLLQQLSRSRLSGTLIIKDQKAEPLGTLSLLQGQMHTCQVGVLQGKEAVYQLLEKPVPGTFVFVGHRHESVLQDGSEEPATSDLMPLILEGMRRHDQLQRACALVPDGASLTPSGPEPVPHLDEDDPQIFHRVWERVTAGAKPEDCEADFPAHSYEIRLLLARWVEEAALAIR